MLKPEWHPDNLQKHHIKRLRKDDQCWRELLKISRSMSMDEYEQESCKSYEKGCIEYEAEYNGHGPALYRVDKRTVLSVAKRNRMRMITCYHKHYHGKHEAGSATPRFENLLEFIDDLEADLDGDIEMLFRIEPVKQNLSGNQIRKYINPKLKTLRGKCVKNG